MPLKATPLDLPRCSMTAGEIHFRIHCIDRGFSGSDGRPAPLCQLVVALCLLALVVHAAGYPPHAWAESNPAKTLALVKSEKNPAKRILLLDEALKDPSLKGKTLSAFFF